jgi:hypothetical protein
MVAATSAIWHRAQACSRAMHQVAVSRSHEPRLSGAASPSPIEVLHVASLAPPSSFTLQPVLGLAAGDLFGFEIAELPRAMRPGDRARWSPRSLAAGLAQALDADRTRELSFIVRLEPRRDDESTAAAALAEGIGDRADRRRVFLAVDLQGASDVSSPQLRERLRNIERRGFSTALFGVTGDPRTIACRPDLVKLSFASNRRGDLGHDVGVLHTLVEAARRCGVGILAEGIADHDVLRRAVSAGARFGQGALLGLPAAGASKPSAMRRALVRAAAAEATSAQPPRLPEGDLDAVEQDVRFTMAALGADPDARDLLYMTAGWLTQIEAARAVVRSASARVTIAEAGRHVIELRFGGALSEAVAQPGTEVDLEALDDWATAHERSSLELSAAQDSFGLAVNARSDLERDLTLRRTWLHEVLSIRAAERAVPHGWANAFFRGRS